MLYVRTELYQIIFIIKMMNCLRRSLNFGTIPHSTYLLVVDSVVLEQFTSQSSGQGLDNLVLPIKYACDSKPFMKESLEIEVNNRGRKTQYLKI